MKKLQIKLSIVDALHLLFSIVISVLALIVSIRYACVGNIPLTTAMGICNLLFVLMAISAYTMRLPLCYGVVGVFAIVLHTNTNYSTVSFGYEYIIMAVLSIIACLVGIGVMIWKRQPLKTFFSSSMLVALLVLVFVGGTLLGNMQAGKNRTFAKEEAWAVPTIYDQRECSQKGRVESLTYQTKAYATDQRAVTKSCNVYLPYGYRDHTPYNILYLMHGTGENENTWLIEQSNNVTMLDNMIADGVIQPLIVVTPTFYVEEDCMDQLDDLTYSFAEELRNDLMVAVEGKYSTYAPTADDAGFIASRDHRAFAGLSRGAVTTLHSGLMASLDYFSYFGTFSGSRTTAEEMQTALQSAYTINYLYVVGGTFDFALPLQITQYNDWLQVSDKLVEGKNTEFDVTHFKRHSHGNWHLNLYNFLQKIF